jgi:hypothetical protein
MEDTDYVKYHGVRQIEARTDPSWFCLIGETGLAETVWAGLSAGIASDAL